MSTSRRRFLGRTSMAAAGQSAYRGQSQPKAPAVRRP